MSVTHSHKSFNLLVQQLDHFFTFLSCHIPNIFCNKINVIVHFSEGKFNSEYVT